MLLSCNSTNSHNEKDSQNKDQNGEPEYLVAEKFINDYIDYLNDDTSSIDISEWVNNRNDVTNSFKIELERIVSLSEKNDPELGLGFDPILNAQDHPEKCKIENKDVQYVTVQGIDWPNFHLKLKLKVEDGTWLVEGSGIINIENEKRMKN